MIRRPVLAIAAALAVLAAFAAPAAQAAPKLNLHFTKTPAKLSNTATPAFGFSRNARVKVKSQTCHVDKAAWKKCGTSWTPGHIADGSHTATVKLALAGGGVATISYSWTIDTVAPAVPTVSGD